MANMGKYAGSTDSKSMSTNMKRMQTYTKRASKAKGTKTKQFSGRSGYNG